MNVAHSVKWEDKRRWYSTVVLIVVMIAALLLPVASSADDSPLLRVIVEKAAGSDYSVEQFVEMLGGTVLIDLPIINGFSAELPESAIATLQTSPGVAAITPDGTVQLMGKPPKDDGGGSTSEPDPTGDGTVTFGEMRYASTMDGSMYHIIKEAIGAEAAWSQGAAGEGVTVALIDSGVVPVLGLTAPGKVINGPDLSFESQDPDLLHLDTFGHGTHMAGIIAGNDTGTMNPRSASKSDFYGVAPGASILNIKVADHEGSTDVSQVIAAVDWVVQHRDDNGMNVRVINLSFGTDSTQSYLLDPLAHAVEQAVWNGIVVVVAAGNDGNVDPLRNPALDPYVIAVGAANTHGTSDITDDYVPDFSNCGTNKRSVDVVAPGVSIVSLRNPGSYADTYYSSAAVNDRLFRGTGTSQAAAVVSGAAAVILSNRPNLNAYQVKNLLMDTAVPLTGVHSRCQGNGLIDVGAAVKQRNNPSGVTPYAWSSGDGSIDASRGSFHLQGPDGVVLEGEIDIFGQPFDSNQHASDALFVRAWDGGTWNDSDWTGVSWSGVSWSGVSWSGVSWSGLSWSGLSWSGLSWSDMTWSGLSWSGLSWSGLSWSGLSWSGSAWSGVSWDGPKPRYN
ncbi:MAG: S8 family serine peptidase [Acidimicrobiia bacterium]|nr:S8 family serine peptidase [Acidimicrobiia bacterium]